MDNSNTQQQCQLTNLIQFAFAEKRFPKVIQLANQYLHKYSQSSNIYILKAKASSQMNNPLQCLQSLQKATTLGATSIQLQIIKMRSYIQLGNLKESSKILQQLLKTHKYIQDIILLKSAIDIFNDQYSIHKFSQKQQCNLQAMDQWLLKSGANYQKLKIINFSPDYRGVVATKHIKKKQPIIYIPKSQLITLQMARSNKYSQILINKNIKLQSPKHTFLSILLLQLKNDEHSKYKPYIDLLPSDHSNFPINYTRQQLQLLQGSSLIKMILQKVQAIQHDYTRIIQQDSTFKQYTFKQFCWSRMIISSRIFGINISGIKTDILVPFADMLNHRYIKQTVWNYQQSVHGFVIQSLQDIQVGSEVFDSYGKKCNSRLLLNYGFVLQDNPDNQIIFKIVIKINDPLSTIKLKMIKKDLSANFIEIRKINLNFNNNKFYQLMGCLRFLCIEDKQTLETLKDMSNISFTKQPYIIMKTPPISIQNQLLAWKKLQSMCKQSLQGYPQISSNKRLQKKNISKINKKNIETLLTGQKHILTQLFRICSEVIKILSSKNIINQLKQKIQHIYSKYLYKILCVMPQINKKDIQQNLTIFFKKQHQDNHNDDIQQISQL